MMRIRIRWWPAMFRSWLAQRRAWLAVFALVVRADVVDMWLAWAARLRYLCTVDQFDAERQFKRDEITRVYRRKHFEIDIELARARTRIATE